MARLLGGVVASVLVLGACSHDESVTPREAATFSVEVAAAESREVPRDYTVPGNVIADERVQISSRISGFIQAVNAREGDRVTDGEILVEIDHADVDGAIRRHSAALASARADLADAERDVAKFSALAQNGSIPRDTLRKAEVRADVARSRVAEVQAALQTARSQRRYTTIRSPVAGVVVARHKRAGDLATPGAPILVLESRQSLVFQTFVAETQVSDIEVGDAVEVSLDAENRVVSGRVLRIVPSGDPVTRRYEVKIALPQDQQDLLPGMFGRARFAAGTETPLLIPCRAVVERGGLEGGFRVGPDDIAQFRWLRLQRAFNGSVEVTAGLADGDRVVLDPPPGLSDGDRLEVGGAAAP